jgi:hypothetical protein
MQRNPYWPLNGPSFFSVLRFRHSVFFLAAMGEASASGQISRYGWQADADQFSSKPDFLDEFPNSRPVCKLLKYKR